MLNTVSNAVAKEGLYAATHTSFLALEPTTLDDRKTRRSQGCRLVLALRVESVGKGLTNDHTFTVDGCLVNKQVNNASRYS